MLVLDLTHGVQVAGAKPTDDLLIFFEGIEFDVTDITKDGDAIRLEIAPRLGKEVIPI